MRLLIVLLVVVSLSGCLSSPVKLGDFTTTRTLDDPKIGETTTRAVGETLVSKGARTTGPALEVTKATQFNKAEGESSIMTCAVTVMAGSFFKRGTLTTEPKGADCFGPITYQITLSDGTTNWNCPGQSGLGDVCHDASGKYYVVIGAGKIPLKQNSSTLRLIEKVVDHSTSMVQELVYNGRSGSTIRVLYREFSNDMARPAYTQELQYDLGESRTVGFRALRLEVVDATNTAITYKLVSTF